MAVALSNTELTENALSELFGHLQVMSVFYPSVVYQQSTAATWLFLVEFSFQNLFLMPFECIGSLTFCCLW